MRVCARVCVYEHMSTWVCMRARVFTYEYVGMCVCRSTHMSTWVCVCTCGCVFVQSFCVFVHMSTCVRN